MADIENNMADIQEFESIIGDLKEGDVINAEHMLALQELKRQVFYARVLPERNAYKFIIGTGIVGCTLAQIVLSSALSLLQAPERKLLQATLSLALALFSLLFVALIAYKPVVSKEASSLKTLWQLRNVDNTIRKSIFRTFKYVVIVILRFAAFLYVLCSKNISKTVNYDLSCIPTIGECWCVLQEFFGKKSSSQPQKVVYTGRDLGAITEKMANVQHKILVLSGIGGVGTSTFSACLSLALAAVKYKVGLLESNVSRPTIPKMLGLEEQEVQRSSLGWSPVYAKSNLSVMSGGFKLPTTEDAAIRRRSPPNNGLIKHLLKDVFWGELDFLVVDASPETTEEQVQILQATGILGAVIITTPQQIPLMDVRNQISFCKKLDIRVLGVVENMSGLYHYQPLSEFKFMQMTKNGEQEDLTQRMLAFFKKKYPELLDVVPFRKVFDAASICRDMNVPFLGTVPLDPQICKAVKEGRPCFDDAEHLVSNAAETIIVDLVGRLLVLRMKINS